MRAVKTMLMAGPQPGPSCHELTTHGTTKAGQCRRGDERCGAALEAADDGHGQGGGEVEGDSPGRRTSPPA